MHRFVLAAALAASAAALAGPAAAQAFKWTDKDGKVQYSDRPPPGAKTEAVQSKVGSVTGSGTGSAGAARTPGAAQPPMSYAEKDQAFRKRLLEQDEARQKQAKSDEQAKQKAEYCQQAKSRLAGLEAGGRMTRFNDKGERVFLDDSQIEAEKTRVRRDVSTNCAS